MTTYSRKPDADFVSFMRREAGLDLSRQPIDDPRYWFVAFARDVTGQVVAGMAVEYLHAFDGFFTAAVIDPEVMNRKLLRAIFATLFSRVTRITATVDPDNHVSRDALKRLGFIYEGFLRRGLDGKRDAELYGMLMEDCKYLPGYAGGTIVTAGTATPAHRTTH
jgi:RimJ/RimL family protein N-acetyltransferase